MWKLVLAECRYHWVLICAVYALIIFLGVSHLLFEGATWQVISTTSSTVLIMPVLSLGISINREKRYKNAMPLPVELRSIGMARLLAPIAVAAIGLAIPWFFVLVFAPERATLTMLGRTLLLLGFLITVSTTYILVRDLRHIFTGRHKKAKYIASFIVTKLFLVAMFASVYMLQYPYIHQAVNLQYFEYQMNTYPGVLIFGVGFLLSGIAIFFTDVAVFQRRWTFMK